LLPADVNKGGKKKRRKEGGMRDVGQRNIGFVEGKVLERRFKRAKKWWCYREEDRRRKGNKFKEGAGGFPSGVKEYHGVSVRGVEGGKQVCVEKTRGEGSVGSPGEEQET